MTLSANRTKLESSKPGVNAAIKSWRSWRCLSSRLALMSRESPRKSPRRPLPPRRRPTSSGHADTTACASDASAPSPVAISGATAKKLALTSSKFKAAVNGTTYVYNGAADAAHCSTLMYVDANFITTNSTGGHEDVVVAIGVNSKDDPDIGAGREYNAGVSEQSDNSIWSGNQSSTTAGIMAVRFLLRAPHKGSQCTGHSPTCTSRRGRGFPSCNNSVGCQVAIWTGLDDEEGDVLQTEVLV